MKKKLEQIKKTISKLKNTGFFSIYFSSILSKVIILFGGIIIVRLLTVEDYGSYVLIINTFSMLCLLGDFGGSSATFQFMLEAQNDEIKMNSYLMYGIKYSFIVSIFSSILILFSSLFYPYRNNIILSYTTLLFLIPIMTTLINFINIILRAKEENKKYSLFQIISVVFHYSTIIIATLFLGLRGSIWSQYVYNGLILIYGLVFLKKCLKFPLKFEKITKNETKSFLKLSTTSYISDITNSLLYSIDIFVIGLLIVDSKKLAIYKIATIIPNALSFLPSCLMIYLLPHFIKHNTQCKWIFKNTKRLIGYGFLAYFVIFFILVTLSRSIFLLLYGKEYLESSYTFIILMIGFLFNASIKIPLGNILFSLKKVHYNVIVNIVCLILNIIFNFIFINLFGYIGAAITTTLIIIIASILSWILFMKVVKNYEKINYHN